MGNINIAYIMAWIIFEFPTIKRAKGRHNITIYTTIFIPKSAYVSKRYHFPHSFHIFCLFFFHIYSIYFLSSYKCTFHAIQTGDYSCLNKSSFYYSLCHTYSLKLCISSCWLLHFIDNLFSSGYCCYHSGIWLLRCSHIDITKSTFLTMAFVIGFATAEVPTAAISATWPTT